MTLRRITVNERSFPPPITNGQWDLTKLDERYPENIKEAYELIASSRTSTPDFYIEQKWWLSSNIDDIISNFLTENKITKRQLHSIEVKDSCNNLTYNKSATIIYEDSN